MVPVKPEFKHNTGATKIQTVVDGRFETLQDGETLYYIFSDFHSLEEEIKTL